VNDSDNVSNLNTFTNSSNINTIPSSILYNRTHRSANGKIMNVLLLLFLVFGSCVVSFGSDNENDENEEKEGNNNIHIKDNNELNNQENQYKCEKADESLNKYRCNFFFALLLRPENINNYFNNNKYVKQLELFDRYSVVLTLFAYMKYIEPVFTTIDQTNDNTIETKMIKHRFHMMIYNIFDLGWDFIGFRSPFFKLKRCDKLNNDSWQNIYVAVSSIPYLGQIGGAILGSIALVWEPSFLQKYIKEKVKVSIFGICPMMAVIYIINDIIYKSKLFMLVYPVESRGKTFLYLDIDSKVYMNPLCIFDTFTIEIPLKNPDAKIKFNFGFLVWCMVKGILGIKNKFSIQKQNDDEKLI
jgi:hypothetical protein